MLYDHIWQYQTLYELNRNRYIFKPQTNYTAKGAVIVVLLISLAIMREGGGDDSQHYTIIQTSRDKMPIPKTLGSIRHPDFSAHIYRAERITHY